MADNSYEDLFNADVFDMHGTRIGPVGQVYLDDQTQMATWITVKTGLFGLKETFAPLSRAIVEREKVTVPYDAQLVRNAPRVDPDKHLDAAEEAKLYAHYGITNVMAVESSVSDVSGPETIPAAEPTGEAAVPVAEPVTADPEAPSRAMTLDPVDFSTATTGTEVTSLSETSVPGPLVSESAAPTTESLLSDPIGTDSLIDESLEETVVVIPRITDSVSGEPSSAPAPAPESTIRNSTIEKLTQAIDEIEDSLADDTAKHVAAEAEGIPVADEMAERTAVETHDYYNEVKDN